MLPTSHSPFRKVLLDCKRKRFHLSIKITMPQLSDCYNAGMALQLADLPLHMRKMIEAQHGITLPEQPRKWKSGVRADLGIFVRSAWEANISRYLNFLKARKMIDRWEYEPQRFDFPIRRGTNTYLPDFKVWKTVDTYEGWGVEGC